MAHDLVIKNGIVVDGSGEPARPADVAIAAGRIAAVGRIEEKARRVIDAGGQVIAPGFIDAHTHLDAQVFWDPLGTCSCHHGVTSVVMGNCGFTLAPVRAAEVDLVLHNLERAEAIPARVLAAGVEFTWETFPELLDALERTPKGINYAGYVGHSALRTYAMGERAFHAQANREEMNCMLRELENALRAGAIGFSTSRNPNHQLPNGDPVASRVADWAEVQSLVREMGRLGAGIFEIAREASADPVAVADFNRRLKALARESGRPTTFGVFSAVNEPGAWRHYLSLIEEAVREGIDMFAQVHSHTLNTLWSFETTLPFDELPGWRELRQLPLEEQKIRIGDRELRAALRRSVDEHADVDFSQTYLLGSRERPYPSVSSLADARGVHPLDAMLDECERRDLAVFFAIPFANPDLGEALELIRHPHSVVTFSDSGAHVTEIADSSLQTHLLELWVRQRRELSLEAAVRMITFDIASHWGLERRGLLQPGYAADIVVFDPDRIGPLVPRVAHDLPTGAKRLVQGATGISMTIVNGTPLLEDGEHTGAFPGRLLRGPLAGH